ncbi:MAG: SPOR domain-containing protein, partial [Candidatus Rokuibacteriota bacterium]
GVAPAGAQVARFPARVQGLVPAAPAVAAPAATRDYFLVISSPLPVDRAQHEVGVLSIAGFSPLLRRTGDGLVQVQVGAFATQANAEAMAARVRGRGLLVSVVAGPASTAFERARPLPSPAAVSSPVGHPQTFGALMERGGRLYWAGWYGPALASFRQAARTRPDSARAHLWWGRAAFKVSRFSEAREVLRRTVELSGTAEIGRQARLLLQIMPAAGAATTAPGTE